jgi:ribosomal subunit interface protein
MTINISSVHFKTDKNLEQFINDKVSKLNKVHEGIIGSDVTLKVENNESPENKTVDIRMKIKGNDAMASKTAKSFEEAVDLAVDALKKQLLKSKEKVMDKHKRNDKDTVEFE